jgi:hypothetical protein
LARKAGDAGLTDRDTRRRIERVRRPGRESSGRFLCLPVVANKAPIHVTKHALRTMRPISDAQRAP